MTMPNYKTHDPQGWCGDPSRGAALSRPTIKNEPASYTGRLSLRRIRLNAGGYDANGTYFGTGTPLYWCANEEGTVDFMLRAPSRDAALYKIRESYPNATLQGMRQAILRTDNKIGARIKKIREEKGFTIKQLLYLSGLLISPRQVENIEQGQYIPSLYTVRCIANALKTPLDSILSGVRT